MTLGPWRLPLPDGFDVIENPESIQMTNGTRTMYFSSLLVTRAGAVVPAREVHQSVQKAGDAPDRELAGPHLYGWLRAGTRNEGLITISGTRETDGSALTCAFTIDVTDKAGRDWARHAWESVRVE